MYTKIGIGCIYEGRMFIVFFFFFSSDSHILSVCYLQCVPVHEIRTALSNKLEQCPADTLVRWSYILHTHTPKVQFGNML